MMRLKSSLVVFTFLLATSTCQSAEAEQQQQLGTDGRNLNEGRSLFDFGLFRKISNYFGWGNEIRKSSRQYPFYYKRPENLPYEIQDVPNRRSGLEPPANLINHRKKKWPHLRLKSKSQNKLRAKNFFNKERINSDSRYSTFKPYGNYNPLQSHVKDKNQLNKFMNNYVDESVNLKELGTKPTEGSKYQKPIGGFLQSKYFDVNKKTKPFVDNKPTKPLDLNKQKDTQFANKLPQAQPLKAAKVESREPVVAVYNNGIKTKNVVQTAEVNKNASNVVHSKFALKNYASGEPQKSRPQIKISLNTKKINNLVTSSKNVPTKKEKPHVKKYEQKNPVHPYPYVNPNSPLPQTQSQHHYSEEDPILAQGHGPDPIYVTPVRGNIIRRKKKVKKERGIIENMSNFASNLFGNIFSRSSDAAPSASQPYPQRRRQRNPSQKIIPPSDSISLPSSIMSKSSNPFTPSPQQGSMSIDAFQPIFVPSYSMDSKLPTNVMKPLIIPQKRQAEVVEEEKPNEPEMINFFS